MQNMDGKTFLQRLRYLPGGGACPGDCDFWQGWKNQIEVIESLRLDKILVKPFALDDFLAAVRSSLEKLE